jgi:hypothetical protein
MSPFRRWFQGSLHTKSRRARLTLQSCEERLAPAVATLSSGVLAIEFTASGVSSESVFVSNDGTNISLTGTVSGSTVNPTGSVSRIVVQDTGGSTSQSIVFLGSSDYSLSGGLQFSGAETVTFNRATNVSSAAAVSIAASQKIDLNANLTSENSDLMLAAPRIVLAGTIATPHDVALSFPGGFLAQNSGTVQVPTGTLTINGPSGQAGFTTTGNQAAQLVVTAGTKLQLDSATFDPIGFVQVDGTLAGRGSFGTVTVSSTGRIQPLDLKTGNLVLNTGSVFDYVTGGTLTSTGTVQLGGATLQASLGSLPGSNQILKVIDNQGGSGISGTFAGYPEGADVVISGLTYQLSYAGGDGNDLTMSPPALPAGVNAVVFGDGTSQRSMVRQMVVHFTQPVAFFGDPSAAFMLFRAGPTSGPYAGPTGNVTLSVLPLSVPTNAVTITFSGNLMENSSLRDGFYNFTADASKIFDGAGALDGDGNGFAGGNYTMIGNTINKLFRIYGDEDGSGIISLLDFAKFRGVFNQTSPVFDFDDNGNIDLLDFARFRAAFFI